jgi:hypothetical protein
VYFIKLALLLFLGNPVPWKEPVRESVDLLELSHKYDPKGNHTFTQLIIWKRLPGNGKYVVRDWAILDSRESLSGFPVRNTKTGMYESSFVKNGVFYQLRSGIFRESFTHYDPEVENSRVHPKHLRKLLGDGRTEITDEIQ